ncbi:MULTISPECIES: LrgB family protein [unclassified Paenibacillus]|uniref:LrgB family protein n=1 Tax=unclassified Paenibacillus TaxID=185978 RepID=UPI001044804C|nr:MULTISPECIES: LrgB family protein [unclassified Paenibacillus]NIK70478.1 putative murein hydrolase (TIGR00659 family) [Paenibacillus sp. BK720]TCM90973.1 putative murein hydrolase (TIGR00659 family) [Paenibacillus sp. BK033]
MNEAWFQQPLFGFTITVLFYVGAQLLNSRYKWLNPLFVTSGGIILLLLLCDIPYEAYQAGGDIITFFLGPATVALAVPFYKNFQKLRDQLMPIVIGVSAGLVCGLLAVWGIVHFLHGSKEVMLTMLPKSVTTPIAIEVADLLGGTPELAGVFAVLTGLLGSMVGPGILKMLRFRSDLAIGAAMGTAAHGIGTARIMRDSEIQGGISAFAMGLSSILTPLFCIPLIWWL